MDHTDSTTEHYLALGIITSPLAEGVMCALLGRKVTENIVWGTTPGVRKTWPPETILKNLDVNIFDDQNVQCVF